MDEELARLHAEVLERVEAIDDADTLRELEAEVLGRRSRLTELRRTLAGMEPDERRSAGQALNEARRALEEVIAGRLAVLEERESLAAIAAERLDLSEYLGTTRIGHSHPVTQTWERLEDVFVGMGFRVADGPEIETDWFNFEALNLPPHHPARSMQDTFHLEADVDPPLVLRTHTSPVQIRTMLGARRDGWGPPIYVVCPGRTYRQETSDATHLPVFHQIEGLVVDRGIHMGHLAGTLQEFTQAYFGSELTVRLRPSYFPFTEPSAEFDVSTPGGGWLEVGGCGMVHPHVLAAVGLDPEEWSGFAFGFGLERLAAVRHGLPDIRELLVNDVRFLHQFPEAGDRTAAAIASGRAS